MTCCPVYVDPFLGAGAVWLRLLLPDLTPPVSWMGGKRRLAPRLLELLDLQPGQRVPAVLGDASWWGRVWPLCLDPVFGPVVCHWLRSWRGEEPRALWFRLRDAGPPADPVERAAGLLWLQARAASGVPVWWEGDPGGWWDSEVASGELVSMDGHGRGPYRAWQATCKPALVQWTATRVDAAGQRQATEPRLLAGPRTDGESANGRLAGQCGGAQARLLACDGRGVPREAGHKAGGTRAACGKGYNAEGFGGMVDPGTIADRLDAIRRAVLRLGHAPMKSRWRQDAHGPHAIHAQPGRGPATTVQHRGALDLVWEWASVLGSRARIYLDPPYQGATGYPVTCTRAEVLAIADESARHGARVVLSEAVGLAAELGPGWRQVQLVAGRKPEWVTLYGCGAGAELGRLFAGGAAR